MLSRLKFELSELVPMVFAEINDPNGKFLDISMGGGQFVSYAETITSPSNVEGWEKNKLRVGYAVNKHELKGTYKVKTPSDEFKMNIEDVNIIGNWPFTAGTGRAPISVGMMENLLKNGIPKTMSVILHSGFLHTADGGLSKLRKAIFDSGLYKIVFNDVNAFADGGAKVRTVTIFCKRGYTGDITVVNAQGSYTYDFRKYGYIVDGGTKDLTDFLISLRSLQTPITGFTTKNNKDAILALATDNPKTNYEKFLKKMSIKGNEYAYAPASCFDNKDKSNTWRVVVGYRPSGLEMGDPRIGLSTIVEPGLHVLHSPYVCIEANSQAHAESINFYLHSDIVERFLLPKTRTSPTLDIKQKDGQLKFIPTIPENVTISSNKDVIKFLKINKNIIAEIKSNYAY